MRPCHIIWYHGIDLEWSILFWYLQVGYWSSVQWCITRGKSWRKPSKEKRQPKGKPKAFCPQRWDWMTLFGCIFMYYLHLYAIWTVEAKVWDQSACRHQEIRRWMCSKAGKSIHKSKDSGQSYDPSLILWHDPWLGLRWFRCISHALHSLLNPTMLNSVYHWYDSYERVRVAIWIDARLR